MALNPAAFAERTTVDYPALFRRYIQSGVEHVLQRIHSHVDRLPDTIREEAWTLLSFALGLAEAWPATRALLLALAPQMEHSGWWGEWIPYLERGLQQSEALAEPATTAELWLQLGVLHRALAHYEQARLYLQLSSQQYAALQDQPNQARALNRLAFLARLTGEHEEAITKANAALALLAPSDQECAVSHSILATVAFDQRQWQTAENHFQQALILHQKYNDKRLIAWVLGDLAGVLRMQEKFDDAIVGYQQALALLEELHVPIQEAVTQMNLGAVYLSITQPDQALALFLLAEPIFHAIRDERRLAMIYTNIGIAYRYQQQWEKAEKAFVKSITQAKYLNQFELVVNTLDELGMLYFEMKDVEKSHNIFREALWQLSSITNQPARAYYQQIITEHMSQLPATARAGN